MTLINKDELDLVEYVAIEVCRGKSPSVIFLKVQGKKQDVEGLEGLLIEAACKNPPENFAPDGMPKQYLDYVARCGDNIGIALRDANKELAIEVVENIFNKMAKQGIKKDIISSYKIVTYGEDASSAEDLLKEAKI